MLQRLNDIFAFAFWDAAIVPSSWESVIARKGVSRHARRGAVGGLPTTFSDSVVPEEVVHLLREIHEGEGRCFLVLPNESRYPRAAFFDTPYHLLEQHQMQHSALIAPLLVEIMRSGRCRTPSSGADTSDHTKASHLSSR